MSNGTQFHGIQLGFGVLDPHGLEQIAAGGASFAVGEVVNIDDFGDVYRIDTVTADLTHSDGTVETFPQEFPGPSTVPPTEARQVLVRLRANRADTGVLTCVIHINGVNVTLGNLAFAGTWGIGVTVV